MTNDHPAPPPELVKQWIDMYEHFSDLEVFTEVARWGANQELEACCEWLDNEIGASDPKDLRAARRPKPLSLKEQALALIDNLGICDRISFKEAAIISNALSQLP